jgi:hypothetical protein
VGDESLNQGGAQCLALTGEIFVGGLLRGYAVSLIPHLPYSTILVSSAFSLKSSSSIDPSLHQQRALATDEDSVKN